MHLQAVELGICTGVVMANTDRVNVPGADPGRGCVGR